MMQQPNPMLRWVNFLHIYQPPWQTPHMLASIAEQSYSLLIGQFERYPSFKATINIAGILLELLEKNGHERLIERLGTLVAKGQIELTGSSYHHAFLPKLPPEEIDRQIELQTTALKHYFNGYRASGFFAPEMAYSTEIGLAAKRRGYQWMILDPISMRDSVVSATKYIARRTGMVIVFRDRELSRRFPPEALFRMIPKLRSDQTCITATDGELYGHQHTDWQDHLKQLLENRSVTTLTVSSYIAQLTAVKPIHLRAASWETRERHIHSNNPFTIWYNRNNPIHRKLWNLADMAIHLLTMNARDPNNYWARYHLDRGLASCAWWWASEIRTSPFAPIGWNPDHVQAGATELISSIRSLQKLAPDKKIAAERLYSKLMETLWTTHWQRYGR